MPVLYDVKMTPQAQAQLKGIINYIRNVLCAPSTATTMLNTLEGEILSLFQFPARVPLTEEEPWHSQGVHKLPVKNYLVYFWINEDAKEVHITTIVYGRREQRHQLSEMNLP